MIENKLRLEFKDKAIKSFSDYFTNIPYYSKQSEGLLSPQTRIFEQQINNLRNPTPPSLTSSNFKSTSESLFDTTANVKILTSKVAMHLHPDVKKKLFVQIDALHDFEDWDPDDKPLQLESYRSFLRTFLYLRPNRHPGLGLSPSGNIVAIWTTGSNKLTAEFIANDQVKWVVSLKNEDEEIERVSGITKIGRFIDTLNPYNPGLFFN